MTEHTPADDEKAPSQIEPDKPAPERTPDHGAPPSDQPPGRPQHEATNPDDDE